MQNALEDYLFRRGYFVSEASCPNESAPEVLILLANYANIEVTDRPDWADIAMLKTAERNLGTQVPEAFYRGFPASVLELSSEELKIDQLLHYFRTYGLGDFSEVGHSLFESFPYRYPFNEHKHAKHVSIITAKKAEELLEKDMRGHLVGTRPMNDTNYAALVTYLTDHPDFTVDSCNNKDTLCRLIIDTKDARLQDLLILPDTIRLVEWLLATRYAHTGSALNKLNLKNQDRKLVSAVIDRIFERGAIDTSGCLEKRDVWVGLLHHLHYRPKCEQAKDFLQTMRNKGVRSVYSAMERCLAAGDVRGATDALHAGKGPTAVLRHLDHLISRIDATSTSADEDTAYVLEAAQSPNKLVFLQMFLARGTAKYLPQTYDKARVFRFSHLGKVCRHNESVDEATRRKSRLTPEVNEEVNTWLKHKLADLCAGALGKVYISPIMKDRTLPLTEGASLGGFNTMPKGTRIKLVDTKKVRVFIYWELVDDIDLSCALLADDGKTMELSWRTMDMAQSEAVTFSGDQTSGYTGGSEYFDVRLDLIAPQYGHEWHYLAFNGNVFSASTFDTCVCRAGYMLRDIEDSGEVFEPATVESSFPVNCASRQANLFALDLKDPALIWIGEADKSMRNIAGLGNMTHLLQDLHTVDVLNIYDFASMCAREVVKDISDAEVVFSDDEADALRLREDQELIGSRDTARLIGLLN